MKVYICFEEWEDKCGEEWASDINKVFASKDDAHNWIKDWKKHINLLGNDSVKNVKDEHDGWFIVVTTNRGNTYTYRCLEEEVQ